MSEVSYMAIPGVSNPITMAIIEKIVCEDYNIDPEALKTICRKRDILIPRQVCMYIGRQIYEIVYALKDERRDLDLFSYNAIGRRYNKDHASAIHSVRSVLNIIETDILFRERIQRIVIKIGGPICRKLNEKLNDLSKKV